MADETVRIIRIETGGSEQTVKSLKDEINSLRDALLNTEKGTDEYKQVLEQLIADQQKLAEVMNAGKSQVSAATGSYNALVNQMAALKKVWRETTDEASRKELGNQIKDINSKLSKMDESIGDFRRNVGNYTQSVSAAFASMGGAAKGMVGPLSSVKAGLTAISSHPIVAVLTALAALLINGIAKGFKNSEEAANKTKVAFAALQGIADAVNKAFEKVAIWIANLTEKAVALLEKLGWLSPELKKSMEDRKKIAQDQIKLDDKQRENIKKNADLEKEVSELRAQAADKTKYTAAERLKFLEEAELKEQEIAKNELDALQLEYDIAYAKLQINKDNAELKQIEAEAYAKLTAAQTAYNQKVASSRKTISKTFKEMQTDAQQANQARLNLEKDLLQQELDLAEEGSEEQLRLAKELRKKELEIQQEGFKTKIKNRKDYEQAIKLSTQAYNADIMKLEADYSRKSAEKQVNEYYDVLLRGVRENSSEQFTLLGERANKLLSTAVRGSDESVHEFNERLESYRRDAAKYFDQAQQALEREVEISNQIILNGMRPMSRYYRKQYDQLKAYYENMQKLNNESDKDFAARQDAAKKAVIDSLANLHQAIIDESEGLYKALDTMYEQNASVLDKLGYKLDDFKEEWDQSLRAVRNIVGEDMDSIMKAFAARGEQFQERFGMVLNPANVYNILAIKDFTKVTEEQVRKIKGLMTMLIQDGLLPENIVNNYLESLQGMVDTEKEILMERYNNWDTLAKGIADLTSGISDIYSIKLENEKKTLEKEGKYTEQERKNLEQRYKTVQAMQIAEATINTISGAVAAFMKCQELGQPWGAILGAVQAAAVTAAGIAQIMKIKQTNPYSDNSSSLSSSGVMSATVTPTVSDFNPEYTTNLSGRSDTEYLNELFGNTKLFVSVVDINDAQERGRVRVAESSF